MADLSQLEINRAVDAYTLNGISKHDTQDAVLVYAAILDATKKAFGELPPEIMAEAIRAGSYIAWREIMGPKDTAKEKFANARRV